MFYVWDELGEFEPMNGEKVMISAAPLGITLERDLQLGSLTLTSSS